MRRANKEPDYQAFYRPYQWVWRAIILFILAVAGTCAFGQNSGTITSTGGSGCCDGVISSDSISLTATTSDVEITTSSGSLYFMDDLFGPAIGNTSTLSGSPDYITWGLNTIDFYINAFKRFTVNSSGAEVNSGTNFGHAFEVNGDASKNSGGSSWQTFSDRRWKRDVKDIDDAYEIINSLRPVEYYYNKLYRSKYNTTDTIVHHGYIAQEFAELFPEMVTQNEDGYYSMSRDPVEPHLVAATQQIILENQQLKEIVESQQQDILSLKENLESVLKRLNQLED